MKENTSWKYIRFSKKKYNITSYGFVTLAEGRVEGLLTQIKKKSKTLGLKGTILLSGEGINVAIAGSEVAVSNFWSFLISFNELEDMTYKASLSKSVPFKRLLVARFFPTVLSRRLYEVSAFRLTLVIHWLIF